VTIPGKYVKQPVSRIGRDYQGNLINPILTEVDRELRRLREVLDANGLTISGSSGGGTAPLLFYWEANGPYRVDTAVDGARPVPKTAVITAIWLYRTTPGSSSSTILDVNLNGTTIYTTTANRPTIAFNDSDNLVICATPDVLNMPLGAVLTVDTDQIEAGKPANWSLLVVAKGV
jgi:hypothetical protein